MGTNFGEDRLIETLNKHGEDWVRQELQGGRWAPNTVVHVQVSEWLRAKEAARRDGNDAEILSISRKSLRTTERAYTMTIIIATLTIIIAILSAIALITTVLPIFKH
jgi:hypothetical protein